MILTLLASSSWFIKVFIIWLHRLNFVFEKNIIKEWWHDWLILKHKSDSRWPKQFRNEVDVFTLHFMGNGWGFKNALSGDRLEGKQAENETDSLVLLI